MPGYLKAMKEVCHHHGALFILDEIMCGMGRSGSLHAWQKEGVTPDLQSIGKGLAAGFAPISGMLVSKELAKECDDRDFVFNHGHTFQNHAIGCAVALEVQKIIIDECLLENVRNKGSLLRAKLLERLKDHPCVGDIRGAGLFLGVWWTMSSTVYVLSLTLDRLNS